MPEVLGTAAKVGLCTYGALRQTSALQPSRIFRAKRKNLFALQGSHTPAIKRYNDTAIF